MSDNQPSIGVELGRLRVQWGDWQRQLRGRRASSGSVERSDRIQRRLEWPVIVAALLTIPLIFIQESDLPDPLPQVGTVLNWGTWLVFLAEIVVMLWVTPRKRVWLRGHVLDIAVVVLAPPFAPAAWQAGRLFRLGRLLRLVRVFSVRNLLSLQGVKYAALLVVAVVFFGGAVFAGIEGLTTWDGVWWAVSTVTTVGYGDLYPHSDGGRAIAMTIMVVGIGFVALLTAYVANRFVTSAEETESKEDLILDELRAIRSRLDQLEGERAQ